MRNLIFLVFIFSTTAFADSALTNRLRKNNSYDRIYKKMTTSGTDPTLSEASSKIREAWAAQQKLEQDPSARAKLYYQEDVDAKACSSCPKYLDLVLEINKIVEKTKDQDVQAANEKMVALTKLKFLYYTVKSTDSDNNIICKTYNPMLPGERASYERGTLTLAAEQAMALPDVNEVQLYEGPGKEIHYYYKGEGAEANNVIEVVIMPDGKAIMKYYKYDNGLELPFINEPPIEKIVAGNEDNYIEFSPSIETQNMVLPLDIKFGSMAARYPLTDILDLRNKTELSFNKQETNLSLTNKDGHEFAVLRGENITDGKKKIDAVVNYEFGLSEDSKLTLGTRVSNTTVTNTNDFSDGMTSKQSVRLELTDHNHEYITTNTFIDNKGVSSIDLSSKYKAGDGFVGGNIQISREGARAYSVDVFDQGDLSNAGFMYSEDAQGAKTFGVNSGFFLDKSLRLSTQYSHSDSVGQAVSLHLQKKVSENTSMVLQVGKSEIGGSTVMYQLQSKF